MSNELQRYVLGFAFDPKGRCVLIERTKPDWQQGLANGLGGSIEEGEAPHAAMRREFREECGIDAAFWNYVITLYGDGWELIVFRNRLLEGLELSSCDEGRVFWADEPPPNVERTARWLYWLCLDSSTASLGIKRIEATNLGLSFPRYYAPESNGTKQAQFTRNPIFDFMDESSTDWKQVLDNMGFASDGFVVDTDDYPEIGDYSQDPESWLDKWTPPNSNGVYPSLEIRYRGWASSFFCEAYHRACKGFASIWFL